MWRWVPTLGASALSSSRRRFGRIAGPPQSVTEIHGYHRLRRANVNMGGERSRGEFPVNSGVADRIVVHGKGITMRAETVVYKTAGDLAIEADIYRPASEQNCPAIVYIHGGALMMGNRDWLPSVQRDWFVEDGFAVVSIDYRLAPETRLGAIATDVEDAFAWVRGDGARRFRFDPDRIGVVG